LQSLLWMLMNKFNDCNHFYVLNLINYLYNKKYYLHKFKSYNFYVSENVNLMNVKVIH